VERLKGFFNQFVREAGWFGRSAQMVEMQFEKYLLKR
jgi:hypothetical protein